MKIRRNMLFIPGNNPALFRDVLAFKPDTAMFDLEDAIAESEKDAARNLTKKLLNFYPYEQYQIETAVRINHFSTSFYAADLQAIIGETSVEMVRLPKVESANDVLKVLADITRIEQTVPNRKPVTLFCAIESALGVLNAYQIATASPRVVGIALGGVDYLFDLNATRTEHESEINFARSMILHAARAAKICAFDCVYPQINDDAGLRERTIYIKNLGFDGKSAIHPQQIPIINAAMAPSASEIVQAKAIVAGYQLAQASQQGVVLVAGQMVDKPVLLKAQRVLALAALNQA